jgi:AraC family transcriptional regulator
MTRPAKANRRIVARAPVQTLPTLRLQPVQAANAGGPLAEMSFSGMRVQHIGLLPGAQYEFAWKGTTHYLSYLDVQLADGETFDGTARRRLPRDLRGKLSFVPAGEQTWGWSVARDRYNTFTVVYFDPDEVDAEVAKRLERVTRAHVHFEDAPLRDTMRKLHGALGAAGESDTLYLESLCVLSAMEISRYVDRRADLAGDDALDRGRASRTQELIEANLSRNISLGEMADAAGLSRFHFLRSFKRCTGETPYQYVLRRRIETAQTLLREQPMTVEAVAAAVGFSSATRFIRAFRLRTGVTPGTYRGAAPRGA